MRRTQNSKKRRKIAGGVIVNIELLRLMMRLGLISHEQIPMGLGLIVGNVEGKIYTFLRSENSYVIKFFIP